MFRLPPLAPCLVALAAGCGLGSDAPTRVIASRPETPAAAATWLVEAAPPWTSQRPADAGHGWPHWRGPNRNGLAPGAAPPLTWSETENVVWKADVPGRGHSSPVVSGGRVYLVTGASAATDGEDEPQSVLAYDAETGDRLWQTTVAAGDLPPGGPKYHAKSSHTSGTPAFDGERLYVVLLHDDALWASAVDVATGKVVWGEIRLGEFDSRFGYGASPTLYRDLVIIAGDHQSGGYLVALDRRTGELRWRQPRPAEATYSSPLIASVAGRDQLILPGSAEVASYDPATGDELWSAAGLTKATATTAVYGDDFVIATAGYPGHEIMAVKADGSGEVLWTDRFEAYVPSPLLLDGHLYVASDKGLVACYDAATGERTWRERLPGGRHVSASLVGVNGHVLVTDEAGTTFVLRADPTKYDLVAENKQGDDAYASPAVVGDRLYLRVGHGAGPNRRETLYCIGRKEG